MLYIIINKRWILYVNLDYGINLLLIDGISLHQRHFYLEPIKTAIHLTI